MPERPEVLAVVQARAGSRGLPGKNIRPLLGKPLLAWIIEAAAQTTGITRLILSTDSEEYAAIGRRYGAQTPFLRPAAHATDTATDLDVLTHALTWLQEHEGYRPDVVLRLQPTNPTFPSQLIDEGIRRLLADPKADSVRPITPSPKHPYKMWRWVDGTDDIQPFLPAASAGLAEPYNTGRGQLPPVYVQVGAMEVLRYQTVMVRRSMAGRRVLGFLVPDPLHTVNIDTELDFLLAELALKTLLTREGHAPAAGVRR